MRIPERPPDLSLRSQDFEDTLTLLNDTEGREFIRRANTAYWHWDQMRRRPLPKPWQRESIWAAIKLTRSLQRRTFGLRGKAGDLFSYWLPEKAQEDLHEIDLGLGGNIGIAQPHLSAADKRRYLINSLMEEAIASSQIEGAATTRKEAKRMLRSQRPPRTYGERMIVNNYRTIQMLRDHTAEPLSLEMICTIQESMTRDTLENPRDAGRLRSAADKVEVVDVRDGEVIHIPPPAEELSERLTLLCKFANQQDEGPFLHPVIRAILLHFWLAYDHPFVDGNGRTARALFYWSMLRSGYWIFEYIPISRIINRSPIRYSRAYQYAESDESDATYFIMFHLRAIRQAQTNLDEYLLRQHQKANEARRLVTHFPDLNHRQAAVLRDAVSGRHDEYTIESHRHSYGVSYGTAYGDLKALAERGLLKSIRRGKQWVFYAAEDLSDLLREGEDK